jgi:hypothetical protein
MRTLWLKWWLVITVCGLLFPSDVLVHCVTYTFDAASRFERLNDVDILQLQVPDIFPSPYYIRLEVLANNFEVLKP